MKSTANKRRREEASLQAILSAPNAPRALLVTLGAQGLKHQPVAHGKSVLNIETELLDHLSAQPVDDAFLVRLRDYASGRLAARAEARRTGGFVIPRGPLEWHIAHIDAFASVEVAHG